jgi:hypothetical protein
MHMISVIPASPFSGVPAFLEGKNSISPVGMVDQGQAKGGFGAERRAWMDGVRFLSVQQGGGIIRSPLVTPFVAFAMSL